VVSASPVWHVRVYICDGHVQYCTVPYWQYCECTTPMHPRREEGDHAEEDMAACPELGARFKHDDAEMACVSYRGARYGRNLVPAAPPADARYNTSIVHVNLERPLEPLAVAVLPLLPCAPTKRPLRTMNVSSVVTVTPAPACC
jgi:hypothetical protein